MASAKAVRDFAKQLELPVPPRGDAMLEAAEPEIFSSERQAVAIGAQLAEFSPAVSPEQRRDVSDSLLIAQLAANKAANSTTDVLAWYQKYTEVLENLGWVASSLEFQEQTVGDKNASVHKAIIPVLMAMLGPAVAATSIVISVLNGLKEMDESTPWITLFDQTSMHTSGAKFQVTSVDAGASGDPELKTLCVSLSAKKKVTQVLFFKASHEKAKLSVAQRDLSIGRDILAGARDEIRKKIQPFVNDFVKSLDI